MLQGIKIFLFFLGVFSGMETHASKFTFLENDDPNLTGKAFKKHQKNDAHDEKKETVDTTKKFVHITPSKEEYDYHEGDEFKGISPYYTPKKQGGEIQKPHLKEGDS